MFFISNPTELQYKLFTVDEFPEKCLWAPDMSQAAGLVAASQLVKLIRYNSESRIRYLRNKADTVLLYPQRAAPVALKLKHEC